MFNERKRRRGAVAQFLFFLSGQNTEHHLKLAYVDAYESVSKIKK